MPCVEVHECCAHACCACTRLRAEQSPRFLYAAKKNPQVTCFLWKIYDQAGLVWQARLW